MASNRNHMRRGVHQAMYKYLPGCWADFTIGGGANYAVHVDHWNSMRLEGINQKRLLRVVSQRVQAFQNASPIGTAAVVNFASRIDEENYFVLTPKVSETERAIVTSVNPLLFVCSACGKVHRYRNAEEFRRRSNDRCSVCGRNMKQLKLLAFCKCGYADGLPMPKCSNKEHGSEYIVRRSSGFDFVCSRCGKKAGFTFSCPVCKEKLTIKPALDSAHYFPFTLSLIDLLDKRKDSLLDAEEDWRGEKVVLAQYFGFIGEEEYRSITDAGKIPQSEELAQRLEKEAEDLRGMGIPKEFVAQILEGKRRSDSSGQILQAVERVGQVLSLSAAEDITPLAEEILEYDELVRAKEVISLSEAELAAETLRDGIRPDYTTSAEAMGFSRVQLCSGVPVVFAAYGYTRKERECSAGVRLHGFPQEMEKKNIYAHRLETEGILFELDRARVLDWMLENKQILPEDAPRERSEESLKIWFMDHVRLAYIEPFTEIDTSGHDGTITKSVYTLLHSISHALIYEAAEICGLDRSSLAEYLLPNVPAVFIYCSNTQGFHMGALHSAFQGHFDRWLRRARERSAHCIFDPVCIDQEKACAGCLFLNEVSCQHFNKDLDRSFLCGRFDHEQQNKQFGFWEER